MAELDLPTLQLQRYFQLVARRKHALVPFAVVGAIVGGLVAFLIPRYYEAYTIVRLFSNVLEVENTNPAIDPFLREVESARELIQEEGFVAEAIAAIPADPWTDHMPVGGKDARVHPKVALATKRVLVRDLNRERGRSSARIFIAYRDQDPRRAADLANSLRELFLDREKEQVLSQARRELEIVNDAKARQERICEEQEKKLRDFEHNENVPSVDPSNSQYSKDPWDAIFTDWVAAKADLARLEGELEGNKARIAEIEKQISDGLIPDQIPASAAGLDPALAIPLQRLSMALLDAETTLTNLAESNPLVPFYTHRVAYLRERMDRLKRSSGVDDAGKQPNPDFAKAKQQIGQLTIEQQSLKAQLEVQRGREVDLGKLKDKLPRLRGQRSALVADLQDAKKIRDIVRSEHATKDLRYGELKSLANFWKLERRAFAPDEATYPEVWLIAAAGCIAGVLAAFVLLIIADFFQNTFKSVDDVQRGLPVPVLGVSGYMESEAERRLLRRRRIAVSLSSVAALLLVSGVVGLYLWDKTKLPVFVYNMLDKVLGR